MAALHYELLALLRNGAPPLELEDLLAELAEAAVHAAYQMHRADPRSATRHTEAARRRHWDLVEAAKLLLNRSLEAPPRLSELSGGLGCSPFHLSRTFHGVVGSSLRRYLARLRAHAAAQQLSTGVQDLTTLALKLGYADHSHFTNSFRQEWGVSPSQFRARHLVSARARTFKPKAQPPA